MLAFSARSSLGSTYRNPASKLPSPQGRPFFEEHGVPLLRVLTDRGSVYCGNRESHEYALYLDLENIEHTRTKARARRPTGSASGSIRPSRTNSARAPSDAMYHSLEQLQADVDAWMELYNGERTHSGKYCYGKTPRQTFIESAPLAYDKQLDRIQPTSEPIVEPA